MNKEDILNASRMENRNRDLVAGEVEKKAAGAATITVSVLALLFFTAEITLQGKFNPAYIALIFAVNAALNLYNGIKLRKRGSIIAGVLCALAAIVSAVCFIAALVKTSAIL